ncbi:hypothetical protein CR513_52578, partial [Mucuna pruriens]
MRLDLHGLKTEGDATGDITWELEDKMREQHPQLLPSKQIFKDENFLVGEYCNIVFYVIN